MIDYELIRSRRKTISIIITKEGTVQVRAPMRLARREIERFLLSKANWINEKTAMMQSRAEARQSFSLLKAKALCLLGEERPIVRDPAAKEARYENGTFILPFAEEAVLRQQLVNLYHRIAADVIPDRVAHYAEVLGLTPASVRIGSAGTRWGSCSGKNSLNFTWKLILAPSASVDYVVIHELCHIREHNHSPRFWALVRAAMPDYQRHHQLLRQVQDRVQREGW